MTGDSSESPTDAQDQDQDQDQDHEDNNHENNQEDSNDPNAPPAKRQKRSRACQACRSMKIRCLPVEGQEACRACAKVNRACIMPGPARKRQKTVHKVAELEKKIDALSASLAAKNNNATATAPTPPTDSPATTSTPSSKIHASQKPDKEYSLEAAIGPHYPDTSTGTKSRPSYIELETVSEDYEDVITKGIIDEATVERTYEYWKTLMNPYCPMVAFPDRVGVSWMRRKRPMVLLAIIVVASGKVMPEIQSDLAVEIARQLSDRVMFYNEKSMDLIQAMLIYTAWYGKHKFAKDLGFNHYIHSAIAMSLDLGLGKRSRQQTYTDPEDAEVRRTWMGCYFMAGNVATVLRLPPLVKYSPYLEECLESLEKHPGALPSDGLLCCLVRLTHMMQDVGLLFQMDDPGSSIPLNDTRTQYHLKLFERQLSDWVTLTRPHVPKAIMDQYEAVISLYIHEIALHNEHNVDDFRPMYRTNHQEATDITKDFLTNAHFEALTACVDAMQRAMRAFLDMSPEIIRGAPSLLIVWTAYVAVAMIRLHGVLAVPDSKYGSIFLPKLNTTTYLDACIHKLTQVVTGASHGPAESFIVAFKKLKAWHVHRTMQQQQAKANANQPRREGDDFIKAYNVAALEAMPGCGGIVQPSLNAMSPRSMDSGSNNNQHGSPPMQQQRHSISAPTQFYPQQYSQIGQPYPQTQNPISTPISLGTSSSLLDPNANIDASTFDIQNWDINVGELDNFENYLNEAGWMGYLL